MQSIRLYSLVNRRQRRQKALTQSLRRRLARLSFGCASAGLLLLVSLVLAFGASYTQLTAQLPPIGRIPELLDPNGGPLTQPTRLYDRSGTQLIYSLEPPGAPRRYVYLDPNRKDHFSPELVRVMVAVLDPGYWQDPGFDQGSLFSQEPQTIPERLALDLLLWQEPAGLQRALRMRLLAAQMIHQFGRTQVLEWYMNSAYFGRLAYGADSAARLYLDQSAEELDLAGAALLAAIHQAPALNALDAPQAALERQQRILDQLQASGVITEEENWRAREAELHLTEAPSEATSPALAFSKLVVDRLSAQFGKERLERGGLRVITTLDYTLQSELVCLARTQLLRLQNKPSDEVRLPDGNLCQSVRLLPTLPPGTPVLPDALAVSATVMDPRSGEVLALIGDTTTSGREDRLLPHEPGSMLSPFVAVAAFARGYGPASLVWDLPSALPESMAAYQNPDGQFHGPVRLRLAIANDYLAPQVQLLEQLGVQNVWQLASTLGLTQPAESAQADWLYTDGKISPLSLAQAYATFAGQGVASGQHNRPGGEVEPSMVRYVEEMAGGEGTDENHTLLDAALPEKQTVLSAPLAYLVHHILSDSTARWPSLGYPNPLEIGRPVGARVGRVAGGDQTWTVGYTPQRLVLFWLGSAAGETAVEERESLSALDPRLSAGMWHAMIQYMNLSLPAEDWAEPAGIARVEVCDPSGLLPTPACPSIVSEVFLTGNEPNTPDPLYQVYEINRETGRLATVFTPPYLVEEQTFLVAPPEARSWVLSAGLPLPPEDYDAIQPVDPSENVRITSPASFAYVSGKLPLRGTAAGPGFDFYQIQAGQGLNPRDWLQIVSDGQTPVQEGELGVWDTTGVEGLYAVRLMVVRQDQSVETAVIQVTVDNTPPVVRAIYPITGQTVDVRQDPSVTFQADASDRVEVSRVEWLVDGKVIGESIQAPYVFTWKARQGKHTLTVRAYDPAGNQGDSETVPFTIQ